MPFGTFGGNMLTAKLAGDDRNYSDGNQGTGAYNIWFYNSIKEREVSMKDITKD
jgi:hypothetical protein